MLKVILVTVMVSVVGIVSIQTGHAGVGDSYENYQYPP